MSSAPSTSRDGRASSGSLVAEIPRTASPRQDAAASVAARVARPGLALAVVLACQFMVALDATVVNIALPRIHESLQFSVAGLSWVLNAFTLTFGGLLLLGGRAGDSLGRRSTFVGGVAIFTLASFFGGLANSPEWLIAARALQG